MVVTYDWEKQQPDINNVFLNRELQEKVFMRQPAGNYVSQSQPYFVLKLEKGLYG